MAFWCIDPINGSDATGSRATTQSEAEQTPYRSWGAVAWEAGDTYLQRRGTTALEQVTVDRTGDREERITLDAYGETGDTPVIDAEEIRDNCINLSGKGHVTVRNLKLIGATGAACMQVRGSDTRGPDDILLEDLTCSGNTYGDGINVNHATTVATMARNITIRRCTCDDNGNSGIAVAGNVDGILVERCIVRRNGFAQNSWGMHASAFQAKYAPGQWRRISGWIYEVDLETGQTATTVDITQSSFDYRRMREGSFAALNPNEFAQSGTTVRFNANENLALHDSNYPIRVKLGIARNIVFQECISEDQLSFDGADGTGMGFDNFTEDSEIRRCTVLRASKQGISLNDTDGNIHVVGCEVRQPGMNTPSHYGAFFATRGAGTRHFINCTAVDVADAAFRIQDEGAAGMTTSYEIHNVLMERCQRGLVASVVHTPVNYSGVVLYNVATPGFASFTTSPSTNLARVNSPFLLKPDATAIGGGSVRNVADPRDRRGVYRVTPDVGANYYLPPAPPNRSGLA